MKATIADKVIALGALALAAVMALGFVLGWP